LDGGIFVIYQAALKGRKASISPTPASKADILSRAFIVD